MNIDFSQLTLDVTSYYRTQYIFENTAPKILIACMPKSASVRLLSMIEAHPEISHTTLNDSPFNYDEKIDALKLLLLKDKPVVCQHHIHCTQTLPILLRRFSISTIILTRNIFDLVVSACDHVYRNPHFAHIALKPSQFCEWPKSRQYDFVIDTIVPWYIKFYVSWKRAPVQIAELLIWTNYDEVVGNPVSLLRRIFDKTRLDATEDTIREMVAKADYIKPNFNVGKSGRGESALSGLQKERIRAMCAYYSDVDFTRLGVKQPSD